jgi:tetratricopeptide (TPR) repeat protein
MDTPMIRDMSWVRAIPNLTVVFLAGVALHLLHVFPEFLSNLVAGWLLVIAYRYLIRYTITRYHVRGLQLLKEQRFAEAAQAFEEGLSFFERHPNLDKWRSILFLSASGYGYTQGTLLNLGLTYAQMEEGAKAEEYYERVLELNPTNGSAIFALKLLHAGKRMQLEESQSEQAGLSS